MRLRFSAAAALGAIVLQCASAAGAEDAVQVSEVAFTSQLQGREVTGRYSDGSTAPVAPIIFWSRLEGRETALATLRDKHKLPIRHQWRRYAGWQEAFEDREPIDEMALDVGRDTVLAGLQLEFTNRGFFDWRTWSRKDVLSPGVYTVVVVYADGTPVPCAPSVASSRGCQFSIAIH